VTDAYSNLLLPIFRRVIDLLGALAAGATPTLDEVKKRIRGWIEDAEQRASGDSTLSVEFEMAKFALVYWIDELMTESAWGEGVKWGAEDHVLEWDLYRDHNRASKFYEHAENVYASLAAARCTPDPLEVYLLCTTLGFRGELRGDEARFNLWVDRMYNKVSETTTLAERPFSEPPGDPTGLLLPRRGPFVLLTVSILTAVTCVVTLAAYLAAIHLELGSP
jgi:type VI secretion system protein ImpK